MGKEKTKGREKERKKERDGRTRSRSPRLIPESVRSSAVGKNERSRMTE